MLVNHGSRSDKAQKINMAEPVHVTPKILPLNAEMTLGHHINWRYSSRAASGGKPGQQRKSLGTRSMSASVGRGHEQPGVFELRYRRVDHGKWQSRTLGYVERRASDHQDKHQERHHDLSSRGVIHATPYDQIPAKLAGGEGASIRPEGDRLCRSSALWQCPYWKVGVHPIEALDDVREQIGASRDVLKRIDIRSPERGIVVRVNYHSHGAVVAPGAVILELLPLDDKLVIEGRINPSDISHVHGGQDALIRLTALNQRLTPVIAGRVVYVSADAIADQQGQQQANLVPFLADTLSATPH